MKQVDIVDYVFPAEGIHKCEANFKHIKLQNENGFTEQTSGKYVFLDLSSATLLYLQNRGVTGCQDHGQ